MKKTTRSILILLALVVVIGGGVALLYLTNPTEDAGEESSQESASVSTVETQYILQKEDSDLKSITITTAENEYTLDASMVEPEADSSASSQAASIQFSIAALKGFDANTTSITTMAKTLYNLVIAKELEDTADLAEYGLSGDGEAKAVLSYHDGSSDTLIIGSAPGASSGRYVLKDGKVYITSSLSESIFSSPYSFLPTDIISVQTLTETDEEGTETELADVITSMTLSGRNYPQEIDISYNENSLNSYKVNSPMPVDASPDRMSELTTALKTLSAVQAVKAGYTQADLAEYGLDTPFAQVEYVMNTEPHKIAVSDKDADGNRYLIADDTQIIYQLAATTVSAWAENSLMNLRSNYILLPNIKDVKAATFVTPEVTAAFEIERVKNEEKSTEDSPFYDLTITNGGQDISYEDAYQPLYKSVISMSILSVDPLTYDKTSPVLTLKYEYFNGSAADEIHFYPVDGKDRYAVETNGIYTGQMRKTSLDAVIALVAPAAQNEVVTAIE